MALLSLKLWQLADLAGPLVVILGAQTLTMALYAAFVTFRVMGKNYDAAVLAAGHCGFGMGATPTAVANMQAITNMYGPSHKAFLIVPLCGAFFVDLINATVIQLMLKFIAIKKPVRAFYGAFYSQQLKPLNLLHLAFLGPQSFWQIDWQFFLSGCLAELHIE